MATDNKQKVLIRSMSYDELMDYLVNSDLNGKIIPKNEDTWHQNYGGITYINSHYIASIIQNNSKSANYFLFLNRYIQQRVLDNIEINKKNDFLYLLWGGTEIKSTPVFRPLIEYKE